MSRTWILVAESSSAAVFSAEGRDGPLTEVETLAHPEGRLRAQDLVTDHAGRDGGTVGQSPHVMAEKVGPHKHEVSEFAHVLANHLEAGRVHGKFDKLVLVAPPAFLGELRNCLGKELLALVYRQVDKNLVHQPAELLRQYL